MDSSNISGDAVLGFMKNHQAARKLMQMEANGTLDAIGKGLVDSGKISAPQEDGDGNLVEDVQYLQTPPQVTNRNGEVHEFSEKQLSKSKLPKEILESFSKVVIDPNGINDPYNSSVSVLDEATKKITSGLKSKTKPNVISENLMPQQQSSNIDYSLIKSIVEECMRKYASALKKTIINESVERGNAPTMKAMKIGNTFSFVDDEGNLYEAELKYKRNIRQKK